jgi:ABC-type sugar transport system substrate-binding protein
MEMGSSRTRKMALGSAILAAAASLAAFSSVSSGAPVRAHAAATKFTIGYEIGAQVPALFSIGDGIKVWAQAHGMNYVQDGGDYDQSAQIEATDALITKKANAIVDGAIDVAALQPTVNKVVAAGIKYLSLNTPQPGAVTALYANDTQSATKMAKLAAATVKKDGKPCDVLIMEGLPAVPVLSDRNQGFIAGATASHCTILDKEVETLGQQSNATTIAQAWNTKYGSKATIVLADNDPDALGVVAAAHGSFHPLIYGMNGEAQDLADVADGKMAGDSAVPNALTGEAFAYLAKQVLTGHSVPKHVVVPEVVVTTANVKSWQTDAEVLAEPALPIKIVEQGGAWVLQVPPKP